MTEETGQIVAYVLDGAGWGTEIGWDDIRSLGADGGLSWVHLDGNEKDTAEWLRSESGVPVIACEALLAESTRPRVLTFDDALLVILRGVNLNPGANPEDMVGIRIYLTANQIISVRLRKLMAIADIRESLGRGKGPKNSSAFLVHLADRLTERMAPIFDELDDRITGFEDAENKADDENIRHEIADIRKDIIALRRHLAPQREVLLRLQKEQVSWLTHRHKNQLREIADHVVRYVEGLDAMRERAAVLQDQIRMAIADQTNRAMYLLTVIAAIFLPLSFVTGLLGINVGGIPGTDTPWAFAAVAVVILCLGVIEYWVLRILKWI